ncbi:hypothetical protein BJ165DRAFT_1404791 [Panaeolus papilionaceus]|nr:hypothetical protein BJ165DRAFT_1404791 [Panaeolus papilionaceus]
MPLLVAIVSLGPVIVLKKVYTSKGTQNSRESWWPPQSLWQKPNACGMNVGYWSEANEVWYQTRKRDVELGNALPLSSTQWQSILRAGPDSQCRTIRKTTTFFASEYFH